MPRSNKRSYDINTKTKLLGLTLATLLTKLCWAQRDLPYSVRGVQQSFEKTSPLGIIIVAIVVAIGLGLLVWAGIVFYRKQQAKIERLNNPEKLFDDLLAKLELTVAEKRLLRQMVNGARLKHPAMAMLSPKMLGWTCKLWHEEKGFNQVSTEIIGRVDEISYKLFGQITTMTADTDEYRPIELKQVDTEQNQQPAMVSPLA